MAERYIGKVVSVIDSYSVVINKGSKDRINEGDTFLIVSIGEVIVDQESGEELEPLEIVKGRVEATHVQEKIATLVSCEYDQKPDKKELKSTDHGNNQMRSFFGSRTTMTEVVIPGERQLKVLKNPIIGDFVVRK